VRMLTTTHAPADTQLRDSVIHHLEWDPEVDATGIGVTTHDGAVTLAGFIDTYAGKLAAERAAKRVRGVRAVANELEVRLKLARADDEIAADAARALQLRSTLPETVQAAVHKGHVTLTGRVPWLFHRVAAEVAIRHINGVVAVINHIEVTPIASYRDIRQRITAALHRIADVNVRHIAVTVKGGTATLTGSVTTWAQRDAAEHAAGQAPGIERVENLLDVTPGAF
jgi:osmotically-inducible protein OsmY